MGSAIYNPMTNKVIATALDPLKAWSGGIFMMDATDGARSQEIQLYEGDETTTNGKAAGLGELEISCPPIPINLGRRVWEDVNEDGLQNACEPGIEGVVVTLIDGEMSYTTATDVSGFYYFDTTNVVNPVSGEVGVKFRHNYTLSVATNQPALDPFPNISPSNVDSGTLAAEYVDSDGIYDGLQTSSVAFTICGNGDTSLSFDFGFYRNTEE